MNRRLLHLIFYLIVTHTCESMTYLIVLKTSQHERRRDIVEKVVVSLI